MNKKVLSSIVTLVLALNVFSMLDTKAVTKETYYADTLTAGVSHRLELINTEVSKELNTTIIISDKVSDIVTSSYLKGVPEAKAEAESKTEKAKKGYISTKTKVRNQPNSEAGVFEEYDTNTKVKYYVENKLWARIEYGDGWGYISRKHISDEEVIDLTCTKTYTAKKFKKYGRVKYQGHTYTFYSEKVLPGGGLKIPSRHNELIDGLYFVCDENGYIVVACDFLKKGTIVDTPVGRKGKVYDTGAGRNNIDIYVSW